MSDSPKPRRFTWSASDVGGTIGFATLAVGLGAYDVRLSLVACGALLLTGGVVGVLRAS